MERTDIEDRAQQLWAKIKDNTQSLDSERYCNLIADQLQQVIAEVEGLAYVREAELEDRNVRLRRANKQLRGKIKLLKAIPIAEYCYWSTDDCDDLMAFGAMTAAANIAGAMQGMTAARQVTRVIPEDEIRTRIFKGD